MQRESDEPRIGERHARFQTVGHAHAIVLVEERRQIGLDIPVQHLVCRVRGGRSPQRVVEEVARPGARDELGPGSSLPRRTSGTSAKFSKYRQPPRLERREPPDAAAGDCGGSASCFSRLPPTGRRSRRLLVAVHCGPTSERTARARAGQRISRVAAEDLIGALSAEAHLHVARGELAHVVHRNHRGADRPAGPESRSARSKSSGNVRPSTVVSSRSRPSASAAASW